VVRTNPAVPLIISHRGNSSQFPENTIAAILSAIDAGADVVEIDVQLSADGIPVVIHDETVDATTNGSGPVRSMTLEQLRLLDAGSWMGPQFAGARIPTLAEALEAVRGRCRLLVDPKCDGLGATVASVYRKLGIDITEAIVGTWTRAQAVDFASAMPGALILRANGCPRVWDEAYFDDLKGIGIRGFEVGDHWSPNFIHAAIAAGMNVFAYTVNDAGTMARLIRMGVEGIETDDPTLAVAVRSKLLLS